MDAITWPLEFLEFLRCCRRHGARTLVFGGFAVSMHGRPRATGDLDLWCGLDQSNWDCVKAALSEFGFDRSRIDALGEPRRDPDGVPVAFMDRDSLIASKLFAGRPQDLADVEQLRRATRDGAQ